MDDIDPDQMRAMLSSFRNLLIKSKQLDAHKQFYQFLDSLEISDEVNRDTLYESFQDLVEIIEDDEKPVKERMLSCIKSPFIYDILSYKTSAREAELKRMTRDLSKFITRSAPGNLPDHAFLQHLLAKSIQEAADNIEYTRGAKPAPEEWVSAFRERIEEFMDGSFLK